MRITSGVVDLQHELVGWHRDVDDTFDGRAVRLEGSIPESRERKNGLISQMNIVRCLSSFAAQVPLKESVRELQATLAALPGTPVGGRSLDGFNAGIDRRILGRLAFGEEGNETPAKQRTL